jgi:hypothetical protein
VARQVSKEPVPKNLKNVNFFRRYRNASGQVQTMKPDPNSYFSTRAASIVSNDA